MADPLRVYASCTEEHPADGLLCTKAFARLVAVSHSAQLIALGRQLPDNNTVASVEMSSETSFEDIH